jgi:hypothetical protein
MKRCSPSTTAKRTAIALAMSVLGGCASMGANDSSASSLDVKGERCIDLSRIDSTEIIDNKRILFKMVGNQMYLNELPRKCPGLRADEPYLVRTSIDRLCDLDVITMLNRTGFGFTRGASCGLGPFQPVTQAQVDMVKAEVKGRS